MGYLGRALRQRGADTIGWRCRVASVIGTLVLLVVCAAVVVSSASAASTGGGRAVLAVRVVGLPRGVGGDVLVRGPDGFRRVVRSSVTLAVRPGAYVVSVTQVRFARAERGVPAGSVAFPAARVARARARGGRRTVVTMVYGTIRSARDIVLHGAPLSVVGPRTAPTALVLPLRTSGGLQPGAILAQAPSSALPGGLFDRVTGVRRTAHGVRVSLKPASLSDAFPALDVDTTVPFSFAPAAPGGSAHAASALSDVDLSFSQPLIPGLLEGSCGASPTGWSFSPSGSLHPTLTADIHRGFLGLAYGELSLTLAGSLGFSATIPKGAHCDLTVDGPSAETVIPVGDIPVPVEGSVDLDISLALDQAVHASASASVTATGGVDLHGGYATPILTIKPKAFGSVSTSGATLSIGPVMQVGLGISDINAHIADSLDIAAKGTTSGCEIDFGGSAGIGLDLWSLHASFNPINPEVPIYNCPSSGNPGGGGGGSPSVTVTNPGDRAGAVGTAIQLQIQASDTDGGALSYSATGLPAGLSISPTSGLITGTPTTAGSSTVTVTAKDATGPSNSTTFRWTVSPAGSQSVVVTNPGNQTGTIGSAVQLQIQASDSDGGPLSYSASGLPSGLSINASTGLITGTPTTAGSSTVTVTATDAISSASSPGTTMFSWTISAGAAEGPPSQTIAAGSTDACAVLSSGGVACWGANTTGQLGDGSSTGPDFCQPNNNDPCSTTPTSVTAISNALQISAGGSGECALLSNGSIECWGGNDYGELGSGATSGPETCTNGATTACSTTPVSVTGITNAIQVAVGDSGSSCVLLRGGSIACWGNSANGELGNGNDTGPTTCAIGQPCSPSPVAVSGITNATQVSVGGDHACALLSSGTVKCWGDNNYGELGDGTSSGPQTCVNGNACSTAPVQVSGITNATEIAAGGGHTCALLSGGGVDCWGINEYGELGDGSSTGPSTCASSPCSTTPVSVSGITNASAVAAHLGEESCALLVGGQLDCWGDNAQGQLGDGTDIGPDSCTGSTACSTTPVAVSGSGTAAQITVGKFFACALLSDSRAECWGDNFWGELGNGTTTGSSTPVQVSGIP